MSDLQNILIFEVFEIFLSIFMKKSVGVLKVPWLERRPEQ